MHDIVMFEWLPIKEETQHKNGIKHSINHAVDKYLVVWPHNGSVMARYIDKICSGKVHINIKISEFTRYFLQK